MTAALVVECIGWTLLHFLWQGALIGCAVALALFALRGARPGHRYAVACTGLLLCLALPLAGLIGRLGDAGTGEVSGFFSGGVAGATLPDGAVWMVRLREHIAVIVACWAACALALALRMAMGLVWIRRATANEARDPLWQARLDRLATGCGITRQVRLRIVAGLSSPVTAGWWRPVVLVPAALISGMPAHLLEALLAHELAHIRRHDYLVNLAQNIVETLLFYHPAVWWMSGRIRAERELIADDIAASQLGEPRRLALALSELDKLQHVNQHLAQAASGGHLMSRITRLIRPAPQAPDWKAAIPLIGLALVGATVFANAQPTQKVDTKALADFTSCARPHYPDGDARAGHQGKVDLSFLIGVDGKVKDSKVIASSGHITLDETARLALVKCSFYPARTAGLPVEAWTRVTYVWALE